MDSTAKHGISSETSSDKNGQPGKVNEGTGRYYECSYCKRGFTNAQALGGHMNIHRKDKAKAKKPSVETSVPRKSNERLMNCKHFGPISGYHYGAPGIQMNCPMYFPASNPGHLIADSEFLGPRGEHSRANLSLQIGASFREDDEKEKKKDEKWNRKGNHEVDSEFLGPRGEYSRANLSLQIGASFREDDEKEKKKDEKWNRKGNHEVDLELRLGHKP